MFNWNQDNLLPNEHFDILKLWIECQFIWESCRWQCMIENFPQPFNNFKPFVIFSRVSIYIYLYSNIPLQGPLWSWSYGIWIYNYRCNQCLSPLKLFLKIKPNSVRIRSLGCQIFVLPSTGFELAPLIHCRHQFLSLMSSALDHSL